MYDRNVDIGYTPITLGKNIICMCQQSTVILKLKASMCQHFNLEYHEQR